MVDQASIAKDSIEWLKSISSYLDARPWLCVLLGAIWITMVVIWPDLKRRLSHFPKSLEERQADAGQRLDRLDLSLKQAHTEINDTRALIAPAISQALTESEYYTDVHSLKIDLSRLIDVYRNLRFVYPDGFLSKSPFSSWQPLAGDPLTDELRFSLVWKRDLTIYLDRVRRFGFKWHCESDVTPHSLSEYVLSWGKPLADYPSGDLCNELLRQHGARLLDLSEGRKKAYTEKLSSGCQAHA